MHSTNSHTTSYSNHNSDHLTKPSSIEKRLKKKVDRLHKLFNVDNPEIPFLALFPTSRDKHRKVSSKEERDKGMHATDGLWVLMDSLFASHGLQVSNRDESFFVGDAAGRPAHANNQRADISDCDALFAKRVGVRFFTEETFLEADSIEILVKNLSVTSSQKVEPKAKRVVLLMGLPGSGKSYLSNALQSAYPSVEVASQDILKTLPKLEEAILSSLGRSDTLVVDRCNVSSEQRDVIIRMLPEACVVEVVVLDVGKDKAYERCRSRREKEGLAEENLGPVIGGFMRDWEFPVQGGSVNKVVQLESDKVSLDCVVIYVFQYTNPLYIVGRGELCERLHHPSYYTPEEPPFSGGAPLHLYRDSGIRPRFSSPGFEGTA